MHYNFDPIPESVRRQFADAVRPLMQQQGRMTEALRPILQQHEQLRRVGSLIQQQQQEHVAKAVNPLLQQHAATMQRALAPMQDRLRDVMKPLPRPYTPPPMPRISVDTAEWQTARHVESLADLANEQHELLAQVRDQLAESEERRAKAEQAAADAEARRHTAIMRATWGAAVVGAVVGVLLMVVLTLLVLH